MNESPIIVLMGPTASGKSAIGLHLAQKLNAVIINADAMQCYQDLQIITARPGDEEMAQVPHRLYGIWPWDFHGHAAAWCELATQAIHDVLAAGRTPILVGGTGMYIKTLMEGIAPVPEISSAVRRKVQALAYAEAIPPPTPSLKERGLFSYLRRIDPVMAARLKPGDTQRIIRALEVMEQTGRSLAEWQAERTPPPFEPQRFRCFKVAIPREVLYARINARFDSMMEMGALKEVRALMEKVDGQWDSCDMLDKKLTKNPDHPSIPSSQYPILKAHGLPELMAYLHGEMSLEDAIAKAQQNTRHYAKRQETWLRHQIPRAEAVPYDDHKAALKAVDLAENGR